MNINLTDVEIQRLLVAIRGSETESPEGPSIEEKLDQALDHSETVFE